MTQIRDDFRSDTVTRPSAGMRRAMAEAEVGDDVFGDDPTVQRLEAAVAERLGKAAGVFMTSGTQSNLLALLAHCGRGDGYIAGMEAHCYAHEQGGAAWIGSLQPQPVPHQPDGTLALADIEAAIGDDDPHVATTRLVALENTFHGKVMPQVWIGEATALARAHGLATHLDGARVFNAAVAGNIDVAEIARPFDTVSVCLSKGLGAPIGSVLVGEAALLAKARRLRKALGGGLRQVGILAAAGLYALEHNVERLADDHANARRLAEGLARIPDLAVTPPDTNIVWVSVAPARSKAFSDFLGAEGFGVTGGYGKTQQRWVTHLDVDSAAIDRAIAAAERFFSA
ncbi:MAG: low-specificity L-threonine aldolase [Hyphomicrobiales bacterium]|nr:MAG: low-specificity L-threonine aldolase [Hyphomicrobiales bacterium]